MYESKKWLLLSGVLCILLTGCTDIRQSLLLEKKPAATPTVTPAEVSKAPTPIPEVTVTSAPTPTPIPSPSPTPAPKKIGIKEGSAGFVYVLNNTGKRFRILQIKTDDSGDWGRNLISSDSSILPEEDFFLYYPASSGMLQLRLVDTDRKEYVLYSQPVSDMQNASLVLDGSGDAYFSYTSKADQSQKDTYGYSYTESYSGSYQNAGTGSAGTASSASAGTASSASGTSSGSGSGYEDPGFVIYSESTYSSEDDGSGSYDDGSYDEEWDYIG